MSLFEVYHITRTKGAQDTIRRLSDRIEAPSVFEALYRHRRQCEDQNLETLGGVVTYKIVGGVGYPINPRAKN